MKRLLAVLVGAGIAIGGGAAAWAGTTGADPTTKAAAVACRDTAKADPANTTKAALKTAVKQCLADQGIILGAKRDALKDCLKSVKAANPTATKAQLRDLAKPCVQQAGLDPSQIRSKLAAARACLQKARADNPGADRATLRTAVKACVQAGS